MYKPKLNPSRGLIIEKMQPITTYDVELVRRVLNEHDEVIIGVGSAEESHEKGKVMTAGERIELADFVLREQGIDNNRYVLVPIEDNHKNNIQWAANVRMLTPHWNEFYTRNFMNASIMQHLSRQGAYKITQIEEQKPVVDFYEFLLDADKPEYVPASAVAYMNKLGIVDRVATLYNHKPLPEPASPGKRALFLGGLQPFHGVYEDNTGHFGAIRQALAARDQVVIAIGSGQVSHRNSDPLTVGKRIDVVRYAMLAHGVPAEKFWTIPIKDIPEDACYAAKVIASCPGFDAIVAGNDWTKELLGKGNYEIIQLTRNTLAGKPLSATRCRQTAMDLIKKHQKKGDALKKRTIACIEKELSGMLDPAVLAKLRAVGYYDVMSFLAFAQE